MVPGHDFGSEGPDGGDPELGRGGDLERADNALGEVAGGSGDDSGASARVLRDADAPASNLVGPEGGQEEPGCGAEEAVVGHGRDLYLGGMLNYSALRKTGERTLGDLEGLWA